VSVWLFRELLLTLVALSQQLLWMLDADFARDSSTFAEGL